MPHVVFRGELELADVFRGFEPFVERDAGGVRKVEECWLSRRGDKLLADAVVVEGGRTQRFRLLVARRPGEVSVRCDPIGDPEKTPGVHRLVGSLAARLRAAHPQLALKTTNLAEWNGAPTG